MIGLGLSTRKQCEGKTTPPQRGAKKIDPVLVLKANPYRDEEGNYTTKEKDAWHKGRSAGVEGKDTMRIGNLLKGKNPLGSAATMAKSITEQAKAHRRANAAEAAGQVEMAKIFRDRAMELGKSKITSARQTASAAGTLGAGTKVHEVGYRRIHSKDGVVTQVTDAKGVVNQSLTKRLGGKTVTEAGEEFMGSLKEVGTGKVVERPSMAGHVKPTPPPMKSTEEYRKAGEVPSMAASQANMAKMIAGNKKPEGDMNAMAKAMAKSHGTPPPSRSEETGQPVKDTSSGDVWGKHGTFEGFMKSQGFVDAEGNYSPGVTLEQAMKNRAMSSKVKDAPDAKAATTVKPVEEARTAGTVSISQAAATNMPVSPFMANMMPNAYGPEAPKGTGSAFEKFMQGMKSLTTPGKAMATAAAEATPKQKDAMLNAFFAQPAKTPKYQPTYDKSGYVSGKSAPDAKDDMRIANMAKAAAGNKEKMISAATTMAKSITDPHKAYRRAMAAEGENYHGVAKIFYDRADALSALVKKPAAGR